MPMALIRQHRRAATERAVVKAEPAAVNFFIFEIPFPVFCFSILENKAPGAKRKKKVNLITNILSCLALKIGVTSISIRIPGIISFHAHNNRSTFN